MEMTLRSNIFLFSLMTPPWIKRLQNTLDHEVRNYIVIIHPLFSCEPSDRVFPGIFVSNLYVFSQTNQRTEVTGQTMNEL